MNSVGNVNCGNCICDRDDDWLEQRIISILDQLFEPTEVLDMELPESKKRKVVDLTDCSRSDDEMKTCFN